MYGDPTAIRALARGLRERAADVRSEADRLAGLAVASPWSGLAADAMRGRAYERAAGLRRCAERHEDAADSLVRHAAQVERLQELIAAIERRVRALVEGAVDRLASLAAAVLPDPLDDLLARFVPPPHGHRDWLSVDLPGVA